MNSADVTCWTLVHAAAAGGAPDRDAFAARYMEPIQAYIGARWRNSRLLQERDDAVQEVFIELMRDGGALARVEEGRAGGFRALLYGVARNVARRIETRGVRSREHQGGTELELDQVRVDEASLSVVFDRAWALALLRQAFEKQREWANEKGDEAHRRIELLRLRFEEDLPVRKIAERWGVDAAGVHEQYRMARNEFQKALLDVVSFHRPESKSEAEAECAQLLQILGEQ